MRKEQLTMAMERMDLEKESKSYCIRGKHVAIICAVVVVTGIAVGLGVGLTRPTSDGEGGEGNPKPTEPPKPTSPPPADRGPCQASNDTAGAWKDFRLPGYIVPFHYDLHLEPDLQTDLYTGSVSIHLNLNQDSSHLWLHIRETFVSAVPTLKRVQNNGGTTTETAVGVKGCFEYKPQQYVVVEGQSQLAATGPNEHYVLTLDFQGWLNGSLVGFYRTTYQENGVTK